MTLTCRLRVDHTWDGRAIERPAGAAALEAALDGLRVRIDAAFHADPPPPAPPGLLDGLWEFEVFEVFLSGEDGTYTELEFGPHGHLLGLAFDGVRQRRGAPFDLQAEFRPPANGGWGVDALVPWDRLPGGWLRGNAHAIHGVGAARRHASAAGGAGDRPDFHRLDLHLPLGLRAPTTETRKSRCGCSR